MSLLDTVALAVRLLGISLALLLLPGVMFLNLLRVHAQWDQRIVLGFALSYSWIFVLSIAVPLFEWNVDHAAALTLVLLVVQAVVLARAWTHGRVDRLRSNERTDTWLIAAVVIASAVAAWVIESPFTGEEALDLASISRFADGGPITFDNTSLFPDTRPVYLVQPYQLAVGIVARWAAVEPIIAFVKFRAFLVPLALVLMYSLLRSLTPTRMEAGAAFVVVLLFVAFDLNTWEWNGLFPFVRRGGVGAGICVPVMLVLCLMATRHASDPHARLVRSVALAMAPWMLIASLVTHPLEMFPLLWFAAGLTCAILVGLDRTGVRKQAVLLMLLLLAATAAYTTVQARAVPYVAEYERDDKTTLRAELMQLVWHPVQAVGGGPTEARELLSRTIPGTTAIVAGIPAMTLVVLRAPTAAAILALGIVPLALLYASPAGYIVLTLLTSVETVRDVNAYFSLLGVVALALGLTALAQAGLHAAAWRQRGFTRVIAVSLAGSIALWAAWTWGRQAVPWLASRTTMQPEFLLVVAVMASAVVLAAAAMRRRPILLPSPYPFAVVLATAGLAVPFAVPEWGFGGVFTRREAVTALTKLQRARASPSVLEWPSYYEQLKQSIAPPLPVPRSVVDELRRRLAPRQVVLADPRYSCALVVLIDGYCINPDSIYGHYFQPAARYHAEYVTRGAGNLPEHPFFNANASLTDVEERLLKDYRVSYLLTDPAYTEQTAAKLRGLAGDAMLEMDLHGYRLYKIDGL